jgi:hypothetical protein
MVLISSTRLQLGKSYNSRSALISREFYKKNFAVIALAKNHRKTGHQRFELPQGNKCLLD